MTEKDGNRITSGSYDEIWGYPREQIEEYLLQCGSMKSGEEYIAAGCRLRLETLPDRCVGPLSLPRTRVRMEGEGADLFHQAFLLHFLHGGG